MAKAARVVVPVLGMHRSGTSLTTGLLSAFGVSLSEDLMPPTEANAMGYFESMGIREIQDQLLSALGSSWDASTTLKPFPNAWWKLPAVLPFKERLKAFVQAEINRVSGIWGFKDPRTARLLPLWQEIFAELNLAPRYVLVGRHPAEVAKSLQARDGLQPLLSELLWLEHMSDAVLHTKERPLAMVEYTKWFSDGTAQARYLLSTLDLPAPDDDVLRKSLERLVSAELRHQAADQAACKLPYSREIHDAVLRRDRDNLQMLCDLFEVTAVFTHRVTRFVLDSHRAETTVSLDD